MIPLSPLRAAQDQAVIGACLASAMASGGEPFECSPPSADRTGDENVELVERARAMRATARFQCEVAHAMRTENSGMVEQMRSAYGSWPR